jgi:hypothetical protein
MEIFGVKRVAGYSMRKMLTKALTPNAASNITAMTNIYDDTNKHAFADSDIYSTRI